MTQIKCSKSTIINRFKEFHHKCTNISREQAHILMDYMCTLTPTGFEHYIAEFFDKKFHFDHLKVTGGVKDKWIDIRAKKGEIYTLFQCKKYITGHVRKSDIVEFEDNTKKYVQKLGKKLFRHFTATNRFSPQAKQKAKELGIIREDYRTILKMNQSYPVKIFIQKHKDNPEYVSDINYHEILDEYYSNLWMGCKIFWKITRKMIHIREVIFWKKYRMDHGKLEEKDQRYVNKKLLED